MRNPPAIHRTGFRAFPSDRPVPGANHRQVSAGSASVHRLEAPGGRASPPAKTATVEGVMSLSAYPSVVPGKPGPRPPPKHLSARALTALVSQLTTGYASAEGPESAPSHFDRYLRKAIERNEPAARFALNPQPLPPKSALLASIVQLFSERMTDLAEAADLMPHSDGETGASFMSDHVANFVDEVCGNGLQVRWPFPWPAPEWFSANL